MRNDFKKLTFINKKTKRVASSHHWFLALAAHACLLEDRRGIAGLLPQHKAKKLLQSNFLVLKNKRPGSTETGRNLARKQACFILPVLEQIYRSKLKNHQRFLKKQFCLWIKNGINTPGSIAHRIATDLDMDRIIEANHSFRWWMDQLKKMQS